MSAPMNRCECHEVPFSRVAQYAGRHPGEDFETVMENVGCGQTCTACHCDLKAYLMARKTRRPASTSVPLSATSAPFAA